jgi:hypothetical protein
MKRKEEQKEKTYLKKKGKIEIPIKTNEDRTETK